ncbi:MAG TPA: TlpA disulfide reductase family protein [Polyangiaceae bacterium]|nr:TlpA disulfide reductase family protein [Polyangiaceae bacterium]
MKIQHPVSTCMGLLVVATAAACGGGAGEGGSSESASSQAGLVGNPAPDFRLKAVAGQSGTVSLKGLRGNVVVVDFWGTFCEPCKKSFPKLQDLSSKYGGSGLRVVGISEDEADDKDKIPTFADTYGAKFAIAWDEDKAAARKYKPETMPSSFVIDRKGVVRYAHVGYHDGDESEIEKEVKTLLGE